MNLLKTAAALSSGRYLTYSDWRLLIGEEFH